jgi:hypothetical protein
MTWIEVAAIMTSCVMAIHMGLVDAVLKFYGIEDKDIPIIRCPKCLTFWAVLLFMVLTRHNVILSLATSFLASYVGIWLDLLLGKMDVWYEDIYKRISEGEDPTEVHHEDNR